MLSHAPDAKILTLEHNLKWFNKAKEEFGRDARVDLQYRVLSMKGGQSTGYVNYPIYRALEDDGRLPVYDLIFVDGRSRFDCLIAAKLLLAPGGVVILHDSHRANYMPAVNSFPHHKIYGEERTAIMSHEPLDFLEEMDSKGIKKEAAKSRVLSDEETMTDLTERLKGKDPFTYLRFGDADLFFIENPDFDKNRRHDKNPAMAAELREAFSIEHPDYLIGCVAGGKVFRSKETHLQAIAEMYHVGKTYHSAVSLQVLYMRDPEGFVKFCKECFWGKRVLIIGGESIAKDPLVHKAFGVTASIRFTDRNAYNMLDAKMPQIEKNAERFDVIVSALGQTTRVLGYRLWKMGYRTQYFDVGSVVDALADRHLRSWIKKVPELRATYEQAFNAEV